MGTLYELTRRDTKPFRQLIDDKAWEHLGLTGDEFRRKWYAGAYRDDPRDEVAALNHLMLYGWWHGTQPRTSARPKVEA